MLKALRLRKVRSRRAIGSDGCLTSFDDDDVDHRTPAQLDFEEKVQAARFYKLAANSCLVNWDHHQRPVDVGGMVYDPSSFGYWIYQWVSGRYGGASRVADAARFFSLAVASVGCKLKKLEVMRGDVRGCTERVRSLQDEGEDLWVRMTEYISECARQMASSNGQYRSLHDRVEPFFEALFGMDGQRTVLQDLTSRGLRWNRMCEYEFMRYGACES